MRKENNPCILVAKWKEMKKANGIVEGYKIICSGKTSTRNGV